jgi:hypothetical protein
MGQVEELHVWQYFAAGEDPQRSVLFSDWVEFQLRTAQVNRSFIYPLRMWLGEDHFALLQSMTEPTVTNLNRETRLFCGTPMSTAVRNTRIFVIAHPQF